MGRRLALAAALCATAAAQQEWFDVTKFRKPAQCERMQCLSVRLENCRDHLLGFYLKEKGCPKGQGCTNCAHGDSTTPAICFCENPPYSTTVSHGQGCGMGMDCSEGQCYRPCYTFLAQTSCPIQDEGHCMWDSLTKTCLDRPAAVQQYLWLESQDGAVRTASDEALDIKDDTPSGAFPMSFEYFRQSAEGYRINGRLIDEVVDMSQMFLDMDDNVDGYLSQGEYSQLPAVMTKLEAQVTSFNLRRLEEEQEGEQEASRRLATVNASITPEVCNSKRPRQYYCSFDVACKLDCRECGWKSATDVAFSACVRPTPETCWADSQKIFCQSDQLCHEPNDCSNCADRPIVDHMLHECLALWWDEKPLTNMKDWVCRFRNKNGMPCSADQDCLYGLRRCITGMCQPFQPYNLNHTCTSDFDCPHKGFYCPKDPTGGANKYWIQYCREQGAEMMTCRADRECKPDLRCNSAESPSRCRRLFSLEIGSLASEDILCSHGWRDVNFKCAPPAKSKSVGRFCDTHEDCVTTDVTGRSGECMCKAWWERSDPKYCNPVAGDYQDHQGKLRDYLSFRANNCGVFWTEHECVRVFGVEALKLKLGLECETSKLVDGPFLPGADCGVQDYERFPDPCTELAALGR